VCNYVQALLGKLELLGLGIDDSRGEYIFGLEERVAKLEREVEGLQIKSRNASWLAG
jgi:hypothetical protein